MSITNRVPLKITLVSQARRGGGVGQGVFLAARRIGTGSGFEHAGGTPLPISKASTPPPPSPRLEAYL